MKKEKIRKSCLLSLIILTSWLILWYFWSFVDLTIVLKRLPLNFDETFHYFGKIFSLLMGLLTTMLLFGSSGIWYYRHYKLKNKNKVTNNAQFLTEKEFTSIFKHGLFLQKQANYGFIVRLRKEQRLIEASVVNNTHGLIIGKTGSGKTQNIIIPTIIFNAYSLHKPAMIITDPKGELFASQSKLLQDQGYNIKVLDLKNFQIGDFWNPLLLIFKLWKEKEYGEAQRQIDVIVNTICPIPPKTNDPHWVSTAQNFIKGIIFALLEDYDKGFNVNETNFNFKTLAHIIHQERKKVKTYLLERSNNSRARQYCSNLLTESEESREIDSLFSSTKTILNKFTNINIEISLSKNTINFEDFQKKPTVMFLIVADYSPEYHSLANLFIQQLYKHLVLMADNSENKSLKRPVLFLFDEFSNMPTINGFNSIISASRSRNIWWLLITQDLEQLRHKYGTAENILSNCDLQIYIHTNNFNSAKLLAQTYGTTKTKSTSETVNSTNKSVTTHDKDEFLISANELLKLPENSQIIKYNRYNPGKINTLPIWKVKGYQKGTCDNINLIESYIIPFYDIKPFLKKVKEKRKNDLQFKLKWLAKQTEITDNVRTYLKQVKNDKEFEEILVKIKENFSFEFILKMKEAGIM